MNKEVIKFCIAEDEPEIIEILKENILEIAPNAAICSAENGKSALDLLQHNNIDILISDLKMPEMSGNDLIANTFQHIKDKPKYVIIISGHIDIDNIKDEGNLLFMRKPIDLDYFKQKLISIISELNWT